LVDKTFATVMAHLVQVDEEEKDDNPSLASSQDFSQQLNKSWNQSGRLPLSQPPHFQTTNLLVSPGSVSEPEAPVRPLASPSSIVLVVDTHRADTGHGGISSR
jgi:hypothetical protein